MTGRRILLLATVGVVGGFFSGLLGVGGGIVMVPMLMSLVGFDQRRASATTLAAIVPTALVGGVGYFLGGRVELVAGLLIAVGGIAGSQLGSLLLRRVPTRMLRWLFVALLVGLGAWMLFGRVDAGARLALSPLAIAALVLLGVFMGVASGLFGIGGGVIVVPVLVAVFGVGQLGAKGTSLAVMVVTALAGSVANRRAGLVEFGDAAVVGVVAAVCSLGGVALAFALSTPVATVLFVLLLLSSAAQLVLAALRERRAGAAERASA